MSKIIYSVVIFSFIFSTSAVAGGWGGYQAPQGPNLNLSGFGGFALNGAASSEAFGVGNIKNITQNFSMSEGTGEMGVNANRTVFGPGSPCTGTCDQNQTSVGFIANQKISSGAMNQTESNNGYGASSAFSQGSSSFDFAATLKGFGN